MDLQTEEQEMPVVTGAAETVWMFVHENIWLIAPPVLLVSALAFVFIHPKN